MSDQQSRKQFLQKFGMRFSNRNTSTSISELTAILPAQQKEFLNTYSQWLAEFKGFIEVQQQDFSNLENNKKLMRLSEEAKEWKTHLASFMDNEDFAKVHQKLTQRVSESIS